MQYSKLKIKNENFVTTVLLDNPKKKNALDDELIQNLVSCLHQLNRDSKTRVVLLGSTSDVFSSGGDVKAMLEKKDMFSGTSINLREQYHFGIQEIARAMEQFKKPIIAVLDGACVGAGADLACMCDMRIGSENLLFTETFSNLALVPGDGGTYFLTRALGYAKALELYLTARKVNAEEAVKIGLLNFFENSTSLWSKAEDIAASIASKAPISIEMTKQALKEAYSNRNLETNLNLLSSFQAITQLSEDHQRGLRSLKNHQEAREEFEGN